MCVYMIRGQALGMVMQLPDGDRTSISKKQMLARLDVCMGGRVGESASTFFLQVVCTSFRLLFHTLK